MDKQRLKKAIQNEMITPAPDGFSGDVMDKIFALPQKKTVVNEPLISKRAFLLSGLGLTAFIVIVVLLSLESTPNTEGQIGIIDSLKEIISAMSLPDLNGWAKGNAFFLVGIALLFFVSVSDKINAILHPISNKA